MSTVLVVGSANQDIVVRVARAPSFGETILGDSVSYVAGGKGLNQACAAAAAGAEVAFVGAVGADDAGKQLAGVLQTHGVDTTQLRQSTEPTGTAHILVDKTGANQIVVVPGANASVTPSQVERAFAQEPGARVLVLQGELPFDASRRAAEKMAARGGRTALNLAPASRDADGWLRLADPLVLNEHEAGFVADAPPPADAAQALAMLPALLELSPSAVITLGDQGYVAADAHETWAEPARAVSQVVDTTGAGDAFVGILAAALAQGLTLREATAAANQAAGQTVTQPGASSSYSVIRAFDRL